MSLVISKVFTYDTDAGNYIQAVEGPAGDNQALEPAVRQAINNFVIGCKQDGIWSAIKASCILAGARTLNGALVPLVGTAPTRQGAAGGWNYVRKTGLAGNGTDNYLDSSRADNADPQNNRHVAVVSTTSLQNGREFYGSTGGATSAFYSSPQIFLYDRNSSVNTINSGTAGFYGSSRTASTVASGRIPGQNIVFSTSPSAAPGSATLLIFGGRDSSSNPRLLTNTRLAFYSIGEALDLQKLDARVTDLITAFNNPLVIP